MKMKRLLRISLLFCGMTSILWGLSMPVEAKRIANEKGNQTIETRSQEESIVQVEDITGLDDEFRALEEESVLIVEEVEQYRSAAKRKDTQKTVVIILAIIILGAGMITGIREKKKGQA